MPRTSSFLGRLAFSIGTFVHRGLRLRLSPKKPEPASHVVLGQKSQSPQSANDRRADSKRRPQAPLVDLPVVPKVPVDDRPGRSSPTPREDTSQESPAHFVYRRTETRAFEPIPLASAPAFSDPRPPSAPASNCLQWLGRGERLEAKTYVVADPLTYFSKGAPRVEEASCIDLALEIGRPVAEPRGALGYYPRYAGLTPDQRANYLQWLSHGRSGPLDDVGYAFLFFYGLEHRLLIDREDLSPIVKEVVRLLQVYAFSGSFDGYLSRFLSFSLARADIGTLKEKWFKAVFEQTRAGRDEQHTAVGLAWLFLHEQPLPVHWAMRIARLDPRSPRSVVLDRIPEQFQALFGGRYHERFGAGMKLQSSKRDRKLAYNPASPSLLGQSFGSSSLGTIPIPDVLAIQSQFNPIVDIWTSCVDELKPLSRIMRESTAMTREAFESLPVELKKETEHPDQVAWEKVAAENAGAGGIALVEIRRIAAINGIEERVKLTPKQSQSIASTAHDVGFMIEPDARFANRPYGWSEVVALCRSDEALELPRGSRYSGASLMLELGLYVAASDGQIEEEEVRFLTEFLESRFLLDPPEARRLDSLKHVLMKQPPSLTGFGKRLKSESTPEQRGAIGKFLVGLAAVNGRIDRAEVAALRKVYKAMGLEEGVLTGFLDEVGRSAAEPVEVFRPSGSPRPGEAIPRREVPSKDFTLDENVLRKILVETQDVAILISMAMNDADREESEIPVGNGSTAWERTPAPSPVPLRESTIADPRFKGLDVRYHDVLADLRSRSHWSTHDFQRMVRNRGLMPAGAIDVLNEWAQERFGDSIIEERAEGWVVNNFEHKE